MEILGYSERGAMNALFYGIASDSNTIAVKMFLAETGMKDEEYDDFDLYIEGSLSEYGNSDLVIIGKKLDLAKTAFFVEAKVSNCGKYDVLEQQNRHNDYIAGNNQYKNGHSSNLFFQLRLKECFFKRLKSGYFDGETDPCSDYPIRLRQSRGRERMIGDNPIVQKLVAKINECENAEYIAIVPAQGLDENGKNRLNRQIDKDYGFEIHFVEWEGTLSKDELSGYINNTLQFNQDNSNGKNVSQILNN